MKLKNLILQKISELGEVMLEGFFPAKYPEARLWRNLLDFGDSYKFSRLTFSAVLSRLRKEGFVVRKKSKKFAVWRITPKGLILLQTETKKKNKLIKDGISRIVTFDIPEKQRKKRRWIREELLELGYQPLQKSVWLGFSPLPEDFFKDLDLLSLKKHIHIFSIEKKGKIDNLPE